MSHRSYNIEKPWRVVAVEKGSGKYSGIVSPLHLRFIGYREARTVADRYNTAYPSHMVRYTAARFNSEGNMVGLTDDV